MQIIDATHRFRRIALTWHDRSDRATVEPEPSLFASLWRYKWYIVAATLLAAAIGYGVSTLQPTLYQAGGTLLLNDPRTSGLGEDIGFFLDPGRYVRNQAEVLESPQVATRASEILGGDPDPVEIQGLTSATPARDLDALTVRGTQPTGSEAVALVDAVVQAYEDTVEAGIQGKVDNSIATLEQAKLEIEAKIDGIDAELAGDPTNATLEAQRTAAVAQLVALDTRVEQLSTSAALYGSGVELYVPPLQPTAPIQPRPIRNAAIAAVLALIASGAWAWWRAEQNQRADDRSAPARVLDAPLLAAVPEYRKADGPAPTVLAPSSNAAEAYHFAVSSLGFALNQIGGKSVVITSTDAGDGKSVTALNVAVSATKDGRHTLLIDADERMRGLSRIAGLLDEEYGLTDLGNGVSPADIVHEWSLPDGTELPFVPAGSEIPDTAGYFRSAAFRNALPELTAVGDLVIIDAPPVLSAAETSDIVAQADGSILVILPRTPMRSIIDARERLTMTGKPILGYVFNRSAEKASYGYGYGYGSSQI